MPAMPDSQKPGGLTPIRPILSVPPTPVDTDKMLCERCGGSNVYRMHAVWRCADCGFKTDCCGW
jgi:hypothetical protein